MKVLKHKAYFEGDKYIPRYAVVEDEVSVLRYSSLPVQQSSRTAVFRAFALRLGRYFQCSAQRKMSSENERRGLLLLSCIPGCCRAIYTNLNEEKEM